MCKTTYQYTGFIHNSYLDQYTCKNNNKSYAPSQVKDKYSPSNFDLLICIDLCMCVNIWQLWKSRRYEHVSTVMIESSQNGIFGYAQVYNYSASGMLIRSDFPINPGTLIKVNLEKPLYSSISNTVDSRVVWCRRFEQEQGQYSRYGIGVSLI